MKYSAIFTLFISLVIALVLFSALTAHVPQQNNTHAAVNIQVAGSSADVAAQSQLFNVTFHEYGLPSGVSWSVTLNNITKATENETQSFQLVNGTYSYSVKSVDGYYSPQGSNIAVMGKDTVISLTFSPINNTTQTLQLFFEGLGAGGIIGGLIVSSVMKKRYR